MSTRWTFEISVITVLLLLNGCAILSPRTDPDNKIVDPLIQRRERWQKQVDRGNWALQNGDFARAITAYQTALEIKPASSEVQRKIGEIHFQQRHYEKAAIAFAAYLKLKPRDTIVRNYLGYTYEKLHDYESAAQEYEATLKYDAKDLYALNHLGLAYKQIGLLDEAERCAAKGLGTRSEMPEK